MLLSPSNPPPPATTLHQAWFLLLTPQGASQNGPSTGPPPETRGSGGSYHGCRVSTVPQQEMGTEDVLSQPHNPLEEEAATLRNPDF